MADTFDPTRRDDLTSIPNAVAEIKITKLRHVAGLKEEPIAADRDAAGIAPPEDIGNAEMLEQMLSRIVQSALSGELGQNGRQKVWVAAVIVERSAWFRRHRPVEDELLPIGAALHL